VAKSKSVAASIAAKLPPPKPAADAEQVTQTQSGDVLEARSTSRRIKTVEDLIAHIEADMSRFEIAASEATKWECGNGEGGTIELHRVFVRLKPKAGPSTRECVEAMIQAAKIASPRVAAHKPKKRSDDLWHVLVIADVHVGRYCWAKSTGDADFDLDIAQRTISETTEELITLGDAYKPSRRTILFLGDLFNSDGPAGATTAGTPQDNDGRIQKVWNAGCDALIGVVDRSASTVQTDVVIVNGNHDEMLTWAFARVLRERFRNDRRLSISDKCTRRQYVTHGANLLGAAHGDKAKKRLPQLMAIEAASDWARCWYREYHTGHLHGQAAEKFIATEDSVVLRTAPSIAPADEWHAASGYVGSRRGMECFIYKPEGGLHAMHVAGPSKRS
jgi:UDP-2,3-diacylglucosamine pyrophosphatase LpxH